MHINCPHCQNPIEVVDEQQLELVCPSCGSSITLDPGKTRTFLPNSAPRRLLKYELLEQLGVGAVGAVFKARDTELDRIVAVKIPRAGNLSSQKDVDRFLREARSAAQLTHPGIVSVYDAGQVDGICFLVSEYVQGATLSDRLGAGRLTFRRAAELIGDVADAIHVAHQHGVIHRDIKPSNIMIDLEGRPHVTDFGLAKRDAGEITMTLDGQVLGTPAYMPPEQARGEAHKVDARGDVYSLGVILYELLTGELPFRGNSRMLIVQVLQDEPRPLRRINDRIPCDLETICLKAMSKMPARRYATARDLADDLRRWLSGQPIAARPVGNAERLWRWCRRRPLVAGLAAALTVVLIAGLSGLTGLWLHAERQRELAEGNERQAQENAQWAEQERHRAEQNLNAARTAVREHFLQLSEIKLSDKSDPRVLRRKQLEAALNYFQNFLEQRSDDSSMQAEVADAYFRVGEILQEIGTKTEAKKALERAHALGTKLVELHPQERSFQSDLARTCINLGVLNSTTEKTDEALRFFRQAIDILVTLRPTATRPQQDLAKAHRNLGVLQRNLGERKAALESYELARDILSHLVEENSTNASLHNDLAATFQSIAILQLDLGQTEAVLPSLERVRDVRIRLVKLEPADQQFQLDLADTYRHIGRLQHQRGRIEEALASYEQTRSVLSTLVQLNPAVATYKKHLANAYNSIGALQHAAGLLDDALTSFEAAQAILLRLLEINASDTNSQRDLAGAYSNVGTLQSLTGRTDAALQSFEQARTWREKLVQAQPNVPDYQNDLAASYHNLGMLQRSIGDTVSALLSYERARAILAELVKTHPAVVEHQSDLINTYLSLARLQTEAKNPRAVLDSYEQARLIQEKLIHVNPQVPEYQYNLAKIYNRLGLQQYADGASSDAYRSHEKALEILKDLVRTSPGIADYQHELAFTHDSLGLLQTEAMNFDAALRTFAQARTILESLNQITTRQPAYLSSLGRVLHNQGRVLVELKQLEDALLTFQKAVEYQRDALGRAPNVQDYRQLLSTHYAGLAEVQRRLIRPAEAAATALERKALWPNDPSEIYEVTCELALCCQLVGKGKANLTPEDQAERRHYEDQAMKALQEAVAKGYTNLARLREDSDLEPLRSREDYRKLVEEIERRQNGKQQ